MDPGELYSFLRGLLSGRPAGVTLVSIPLSGPITGRWVDLSGAAAACHWVSRQSGAANFYWTPAETHEPLARKPRKVQVARVPWAWVDVDPEADTAEDLALERVQIEARLHRSDPDLLIDSGRGFWAFWRLLEALEGEQGLVLAEQINRALAEALDGDKSAWNADRLARLPGTTSVPNKKKAARGAKSRLARGIVVDWIRKRSAEAILAAVPGGAEALHRVKAAPETTANASPRSLRSHGPTAADVAGAALRPLSLDELVAFGFAESSVRLAFSLVDAKGKRYDTDRSAAAFAFAKSCAHAYRRGARSLTPEVVARALLCPELPVAAHILEQSDPFRAAWRAADRAFREVESEVARWRVRRRGGASRP